MLSITQRQIKCIRYRILGITLANTLLTGLLGYVSLGYVSLAHAQSQRVASVFAETIEVREFASRIEALGTLEPNERVDLTLNAADRVQKIYFDDGQRVEEGQTLLSLAQAEQRALVEAEEAKVAEAQRQLERVKRLIKRKVVSQSEVDQAQRDIDSARAQLRAVQSRQKDRVLVAPFDGVLGFRQVSVGSYVQPGAVVARLIDDSEMKLEFSVPSTFLRLLSTETVVTARTDDRPGETFTGTVQTVDNAIDPVTRSVKVRAALPNPDRVLVAGMFMEVTLIADPRFVAAVPEEAIEPVGPRSYVYVIENRNGGQVAVRKEITPGIHQDGYIEVLSGVSAGEKVVTEGIIQVRDGSPVKILPKSILAPGDATTTSDAAVPAAARN